MVLASFGKSLYWGISINKIKQVLFENFEKEGALWQLSEMLFGLCLVEEFLP